MIENNKTPLSHSTIIEQQNENTESDLYAIFK